MQIGVRKGRSLLDHPGRLQKSRRNLLAKGDRAFGRHTFAASVTMPALRPGSSGCDSGYSRLGALAAGISSIGMYVALSYFLGADVAQRIGSGGTRVLLGVLVVVAIGLGIRTGYARWRAARQERPREPIGIKAGAEVARVAHVVCGWSNQPARSHQPDGSGIPSV